MLVQLHSKIASRRSSEPRNELKKKYYKMDGKEWFICLRTIIFSFTTLYIRIYIQGGHSAIVTTGLFTKKMKHANNFTFNTDSSLGLVKTPSIVHCGVLAPLYRNCRNRIVSI